VSVRELSRDACPSLVLISELCSRLNLVSSDCSFYLDDFYLLDCELPILTIPLYTCIWLLYQNASLIVIDQHWSPQLIKKSRTNLDKSWGRAGLSTSETIACRRIGKRIALHPIDDDAKQPAVHNPFQTLIPGVLSIGTLPKQCARTWQTRTLPSFLSAPHCTYIDFPSGETRLMHVRTLAYYDRHSRIEKRLGTIGWGCQIVTPRNYLRPTSADSVRGGGFSFAILREGQSGANPSRLGSGEIGPSDSAFARSRRLLFRASKDARSYLRAITPRN